MAETTIEVAADSLPEARKKAKSQVPEGHIIISQKVLADGKTKSVTGVADTTEAAFEKARSELPSDVEVIEKQQVITPEQKVITVEASDEESAMAQAKHDIAKTARIEGITLQKPAKKGLFGIGRKPNCYGIQVFEQAVVEIKYKSQAKIRVTLEETPEVWARNLKEKKGYRALAAIFYSEDYSKKFDKWTRRDLASKILLEAGTEAIDAILEELNQRGWGGDVAELLVEIGDPKAVPLLKKLLDREALAGEVTVEEDIKEFIQKHPDHIGQVEMAKCLLCGKIRPVTEMRGCEEEDGQTVGFCARACWKKRGRILGSEDGANCPYYNKDRMCVPPIGEASPCTFTFKVGPSFTSCHVYRTYPTS